MKYLLFLSLISFQLHAQNASKIHSFQTVFRGSKTPTEISKSAYGIANEYFHFNKDSTKKYIEICLKNADLSSDFNVKARAHRINGNFLLEQNEFEQSIKEKLIALNFFEKAKNTKETGLIYSNLGFGYKIMANAQNIASLSEKAKVYALKSVEIIKSINDSVALVNCYIDLGIIQSDLKDFKGAKETFLSALKISDKLNLQGRIPGILNADLGKNCIDFADYDKAIYYLKKSIDYHNSINYQKGLEHAHRNLADAYRLKKDFNSAIFHSKIAVEIAEKLKDNHRLFNSYNALFQAQEANGDYKGAFKSLKLSKMYEDSTLKIEKLKSIADIETKYQTVKKEAEIGILGEKNKAQNRQLWFLLAGLVLAIGSIGAIYWQNQKIKASQKLVSEQADQLKLMMKELHHRVKNNLAIVSGLLRIQSNKLEDESAIQAVRQGQQRVDAMSLIHQKLYQTDKVTSVNIKEYITDLCESLMQAYGFEPNKFDLNIAVEKEEMDVDLAIPLGLIINELLTNSFKYAYENIEKPALNISLKGDKNLAMEIKDNGIGIDLERWKNAKDSFGKKMIAGLVNQVGGKFTIENDGGTVFKMKIAA